MSTEIILIIVLSILATLLGGLLLNHIRTERREASVLSKMDLLEFSGFLRANSQEGNMPLVAAKVSSVLIKTFGCKRLIFLRKQRETLALNYYHGIINLNRREFQWPLRSEIAAKLSKDFLPMKIESLKVLVSPRFYEILTNLKVDIYFPIYRRNNLYGVYFVTSNKETRSPAFALLIASMAYSLAATFPLGGQESHEEEIQGKSQSAQRPRVAGWPLPNRAQIASAELLSLIKVKDANSLLTQLIEKVGEKLKLEKFLFTYYHQFDSRGPKCEFKGLKEKVEPPQTALIGRLSIKIRGRGPQLIEKLQDNDSATDKYLKRLRQQGLQYIVDFPLSEASEGFLAWSGPSSSKELQNDLTAYQKLARDLFENARAYQEAEQMSYTDSLTGLSNQRYMYKRLEEEINRARRYSRPVAFIIFDIDDLKNINDSYGHQAGDALLTQVGQALKKSTRTIDIVARYGGDEFCVVMPESDQETCIKFMHRIMDTIVATRIELESNTPPVRCTISMGGALFPQHAKEPQKLVYAADMALLQAKEKGRNRFLVYSALESPAGS